MEKGKDYRGIENLSPGPFPSVVVVITGEATAAEPTIEALSTLRYEGELTLVAVTDTALRERDGAWRLISMVS